MTQTVRMTAEERSAARSVLTGEQVAKYVAMRSDGVTHNIAVICSARCPPGVHLPDKRLRLADSSSMLGRKALRTGQYMDALARPEMVKKHGSDPCAYVDSRKEAQRRADEMGLRIVDRADIENAMNNDEKEYRGTG